MYVHFYLSVCACTYCIYNIHAIDEALTFKCLILKMMLMVTKMYSDLLFADFPPSADTANPARPPHRLTINQSDPLCLQVRASCDWLLPPSICTLGDRRSSRSPMPCCECQHTKPCSCPQQRINSFSSERTIAHHHRKTNVQASYSCAMTINTLKTECLNLNVSVLEPGKITLVLDCCTVKPRTDTVFDLWVHSWMFASW